MRYLDTPVQAVNALREGLLIAHCTTSLPGFAADPFNEDALDRLDTIKARTAGQGYIAISGFAKHFTGWVADCPLTEHLLWHAWDGPVTIIGPAGNDAPRRVRGPGNTVALRLDQHPAVRALTAALDRPLVSTSLNRAGQPATTSLEAIDPSLEELLAGVFSTGDPSLGVASTLVTVEQGALRCLRDGEVSMTSIEEVAERFHTDRGRR